jgi:hypothetical protein
MSARGINSAVNQFPELAYHPRERNSMPTPPKRRIVAAKVTRTGEDLIVVVRFPPVPGRVVHTERIARVRGTDGRYVAVFREDILPEKSS